MLLSGVAQTLVFQNVCGSSFLKAQTAGSLGEPQPRVSELLNGKIAHKSVDKVLHYAGQLGIEATAKFAQTHKEVVEKGLGLAPRIV